MVVVLCVVVLCVVRAALAVLSCANGNNVMPEKFFHVKILIVIKDAGVFIYTLFRPLTRLKIIAITAITNNI